MRKMSERARENKNHKQREERRERRENGLCSYCSRPAVHGMRVCAYHEEVRRLYYRRYDRDRRRKSGAVSQMKFPTAPPPAAKPTAPAAPGPGVPPDAPAGVDQSIWSYLVNQLKAGNITSGGMAFLARHGAFREDA